ncbi:MAG TPA: ABC transporter permease [Candidatus Acidoferrum sp.]|jgi:predicted permease
MWRRKRILQDLDQEIRDHIEMATRESIDSGMSPEEARHAALRKFGNVTRVKEDTREVWNIVWLEQLLQDIRFGLRVLRNSPGFAAVAVLTLALGIGANTAIFSLIDAVMLRSLPVDNPSRLVLLKWGARNPPNVHGYQSAGDCPADLGPGTQAPSGCSFSEPMFREIVQSNMFSGTAAFANSGRLNLTGNGPATVINGQLVSGDFFRTMGLKAARGRLLDATDDDASAAAVAVLNYGYWQSAFGGSRDVVGRMIELNSVPFIIIGVAEQRFTGITPGSDYDVWLPLSCAKQIIDTRRWQNRQSDASYWWLTIIGRLKPETQLAQVQPQVSGLFRNEVLYGPVPLFHSGESAGTPTLRPGAAVTGGAIRHQEIQGAPAGGHAPASMPTTPPSSGNKPPIVAMPPGATPPGRPRPSDRLGEQKTVSTADDNPGIALVPAQSGLTGNRARYANPLYVLMLAVGIILLIAGANVAGLMLARASTRQQEMAVRLALGAGRARLARQLLTESVVLSLLGGALGILFAYRGAHTIISFVSSNQTRPLGFATGVDLRVLGFTVAISLLTGILFGMAPAFRSSRTDLTPALKDGGNSASSRHAGGKWFSVGNALVVAQVALAIVVLVGAGLLVRTLANLRSIDAGFDSHNILIFGVDPTLIGYKGPQIDSFCRDLQGRLSETPGVKSASYSMLPLLSNGLMITAFHWPGTPQDQMSEADALGIGPNFFATLHIPFLSGRGFEASDFNLSAANNGTAPTSAPTPAIVNHAFVEKYLGKENPLGKQFGQADPDENGPGSSGYEIIGVVRDAKYNDLRREIQAMIYTPQTLGGAVFELRMAADPRAILPAVREVVAQVNPNLPLFDVKTESEQIDRLLFQERLVARLSGFFALLALVLACVGLYGLLSYEVSRRTREIGIRMALGAQSGNVLKLVLRQGMVLTIVGAIVGVGVALGVMRYLKSMLYDVHANDPLTLIAVALLLTMVALAACYIPARRAMRVDPIVALRYE